MTANDVRGQPRKTPESPVRARSVSTGERADMVRRHTEAIAVTGSTAGIEIDGRPIILLIHRGARSGTLRQTPVMKVEYEDSYIVVASKGGSAEHPAWYHNIRAHPILSLQDGEIVKTVHAREVSGEERDLLWQVAVAAYPPYATYQTRTDRTIPVVILEPPLEVPVTDMFTDQQGRGTR
jgi:F420H(2)-dependent quinone reductase